MRQWVLAWIVVIVGVSPASAQVERYDAGRRLIAFEMAWDAQGDAAARKRAIPHLKSALSSFFANKYGEAGRYLDAARHALASDAPRPADVAWAESLAFRPERRLVELAEAPVKLGIKQLYSLDSELPGHLKLAVKLISEGVTEPVHQLITSAIPQDIAVDLTGVLEGDHRLEISLTSGEQTLTRFGYQVSVVKDRDRRLAAIGQAVASLPKESLTTEQRTLRAHAGILHRLAGRAPLETDYPAHRLLVEAESLAKLPADGRYFDATRSGQFWMTLATDKADAPIRMYVPPQTLKGDPLPLVIAMHGAGGTENMFFDAYGHGEIVRQCEKRGWLLVAPRANFFGNAPICAIVDELAKRYPVDQSRVFLVGHSMGAGQAMAVAQQCPNRWAGVAALGGSGGINKLEAFQQVPLFVGCGTEDFALPGARAVAKKLAGKADRFVSKEYPDIEHILIVQVALPDVFKWFDTLPSR